MTAEHIDSAIAKALNKESGIDKEILNIQGFSTENIRMLFHELCKSKEPITYLEVGLFCGASFCASFNSNTTSIGVEDHSQDFSAGFDQVKQQLKDNYSRFSHKAKESQIHYTDCFSMDISILPKIDIYSYDGFHSEEHQAKALPYFFERMNDTFIWVIDDINWNYVESGTHIGLNELKDKIDIIQSWTLRGYSLNNDPIWHNGVRIYLIKKK